MLQLQHGEEFSEKDLNKGEKLKLNKLNWMYEDMPFESDPASEKTNEGGFIEHNTEFLEGKAQVENLLQGKKSFKRDQGSGDNISRILNVGKTTVGAPSSRKDDPLLMIKRERMQVARGNNGLRKPSSSGEVEPSTKDIPLVATANPQVQILRTHIDRQNNMVTSQHMKGALNEVPILDLNIRLRYEVVGKDLVKKIAQEQETGENPAQEDMASLVKVVGENIQNQVRVVRENIPIQDLGEMKIQADQSTISRKIIQITNNLRIDNSKYTHSI